MTQLKKMPLLSGLCAGLGFLCLLLRQWLMGTGLDEKGLLLPGQPVEIFIWVITASVCVLLVWAFLSWEKHTTCLFPNEPLSAVATLFLASGYVIALLQLPKPLDLLGLINFVLGAISVLCMALVAWGQFRGQRMHPLLYCCNILFHLAFMLLQYPGWSREAQPQMYLFQLVGCAGMLVTVFCRAELAAGKISGRNYAVFSRGALFFCIAAVAHCGQPLMYLCFALSILLDGCRLQQKQPKAEQGE